MTRSTGTQSQRWQECVTRPSPWHPPVPRQHSETPGEWKVNRDRGWYVPEAVIYTDYPHTLPWIQPPRHPGTRLESLFGYTPNTDSPFLKWQISIKVGLSFRRGDGSGQIFTGTIGSVHFRAGQRERVVAGDSQGACGRTLEYHLPSKHDSLKRCCVNVGPVSKTVGQR